MLFGTTVVTNFVLRSTMKSSLFDLTIIGGVKKELWLEIPGFWLREFRVQFIDLRWSGKQNSFWFKSIGIFRLLYYAYWLLGIWSPGLNLTSTASARLYGGRTLTYSVSQNFASFSLWITANKSSGNYRQPNSHLQMKRQISVEYKLTK